MSEWTTKNEFYLNEIMEQAKLYKWLYYNKSSTYNIINNIFSISALIITPSSGLMAISEPLDFWKKIEFNYLPYIIGGANFLSCLLILINKQVNFLEKSIECKKTSEILGSIEIEIKEQLSFTERENPKQFTQRIVKKFQDCLNNAPIIPIEKKNIDSDLKLEDLKSYSDIENLATQSDKDCKKLSSNILKNKISGLEAIINTIKE